jgi:hypothetical protein
MSGGLIPALRAWSLAAGGALQLLAAGTRSGATRWTSSISSAWAASCAYLQQLGRSYSPLRAGQVSGGAFLQSTLQLAGWGETAPLLSCVLSDLWSVLSSVLSVTCEVAGVFVANNYYILFIIVNMMVVSELLFWLAWRVMGCGLALAEARATIAEHPEFHRMALRLQLYRCITGRQHRRRRSVRVLRRPVQLRGEFIDPTPLQLRAVVCGAVIAMALAITCAAYAYPAAVTFYAERFVTKSPEPACWVERDLMTELELTVCGIQDSESPRWDWGGGGGATTALSPFDATVELIVQVWRETVAALTENQFDRSSWSEVEAVLVSGASTPLILPPRSDLPQVSPSFSTSRDSSHAELSRLLTLIRSSAAREALDPTPFNLPQLFLARPSEAALQLVSVQRAAGCRLCNSFALHGRLAEPACWAVGLCFPSHLHCNPYSCNLFLNLSIVRAPVGLNVPAGCFQCNRNGRRRVLPEFGDRLVPLFA